MTQEKWGLLRQNLLKAIGQNNYRNWIEPLEFAELADGVAVFNVPTTFTGNYVLRNFGDMILYELNNSGERVQRVTFEVANMPTRPSAQPASAPRAQAEERPAPALLA